MKQTILLTCLVILTICAGIASAQDPTPTQLPWATLTPLPQVGSDPMDLGVGTMVVDMSEAAVQGYQWANRDDILDLFWAAILLFIIILGIWGIIARIQDL